MFYKRVLTIQDISCIGQCSMTVAPPILSACQLETCILPSAVLSSHTGGFQKPHVRDLSGDMPLIAQKWKQEGIFFDAVYTGYLGSIQQIDFVKSLLPSAIGPIPVHPVPVQAACLTGEPIVPFVTFIFKLAPAFNNVLA